MTYTHKIRRITSALLASAVFLTGCEEEVEELKDAMDPMTEKLEEIRLSPLKKNCDPRSVGILWMRKNGKHGYPVTLKRLVGNSDRIFVKRNLDASFEALQNGIGGVGSVKEQIVLGSVSVCELRIDHQR